MSQQQYNNLMSIMLKEKQALAKLRAELEGHWGKMYFECKKFGHLAQNCRNKKEEEKRGTIPQNKFKVLSSRVMQCGVEERVVRRISVEVECYKCGEKGHKCRECLLWGNKVKRVARPNKGKAHQRLVHPEMGNVQEIKLRRVEKERATCPTQGKAQQEEWKKSLWEVLRKKAE